MIFSTFFASGLLLLLLQTTVIPQLPGWLGRPDILFILVVYCAIRLPLYSGMLLCLFFGMLLDIFSGLYIGLDTICYLLFFFTLRGLSGKLALEYLTHQPVLCASGYLLTNGAIFLMANMLSEGGHFTWPWRQILLGALTTAIFSIPLVHLFDMLLEFCRRRRHQPHRRTA